MTLSTAIKCILMLAAVVPPLSGAMSVVAPKRPGVPVPREVARQLVNSGEEGEFRAEAVDLNDDGTPELIVQVGCSAVGNCSTYIFRKTRAGYQQLLNDEAQMVRTGRVGTRRHRDIIFQVHGSAYESNILTYKFDGEEYHLKGCIYREYSYLDKRGRFYVRKRPQITRC
jgi:hypothetical protein